VTYRIRTYSRAVMANAARETGKEVVHNAENMLKLYQAPNQED